MLDLVYDSVINARDKYIEDTAEKTSGRRTWNFMKAGAYEYTADDVVTHYAQNYNQKTANLDAVLETWYTLPTAGGNE